jgi:hypothetical protein
MKLKFRSPSGKEHEAACADELSALRRQYVLMRVRQSWGTHLTVAKHIRDLKKAVDKAADILDQDLGGRFQIEISLRSVGVDAVRATETLHALADAAEQALLSLKSAYDGPGVRGENPETWLFVQLYDLYVNVTGSKRIGVDGPLYSFIREKVRFIDKNVVVPEPIVFRSRLRAALKRRDLAKSPQS